MERILKESIKIATNDRSADLHRTKKGGKYFMACYPPFPELPWVAWLDDVEAKASYENMEKIRDFIK